jgi:hypothetical protein
MSMHPDADLDAERPDDDEELTPFPDNRITPLADEHFIDPGRYMCHHPTEPPVERSDVPSRTDLTQEAVATVLATRIARGDEVCTECERLINEDRRLALAAYVRARVEFYRSRRGRGTQPITPVSMQEEGIDPPAPEAVEPTEGLVMVREIIRERRPQIRSKKVVRIVLLMHWIQANHGRRRPEPVPDEVRAELARLRKSTGLPLDTTLL